MKSTTKTALYFGISVLSFVMGGNAMAQDTAPSSSPDHNQAEIIVTATRRSETINKVPISVEAFNQAKMDAQGVRSVQDIARLTPGLTFTPSSDPNGGRSVISIRGISSTAGAATTGIYIDDTPIQARSFATSVSNAYPEVFDLDRVEVLRGPQGTLFGAGAEGGVVRFITPQPSLEKYTGYVRSEISATENGDPGYEAGAAFGGPIVSDKLGFRVSADFRRDGGWIDRTNFSTGTVEDKSSNGQNTTVLRGALTFKPTERLSITPTIQYQKQHSYDTPFYFDSTSDPGKEDYKNGRTIAQPLTDKFLLYSVKAAYDLDFAQLISNTSYFDRKVKATRDYQDYIQSSLGLSPDPVQGETDPVFINDKQKSFSQEVRLQSTGSGRLHWVLGGYYGRNKMTADELYTSSNLDGLTERATNGASFCPTGGCTAFQLFGVEPIAGGGYFLGDQTSIEKQLAGFGQVDWEIVHRLTLTAGVRVADVKFKFNAETAGPIAGGTILSSGNQKQTPATPKFAVAFQATPNNLFYASASKGFRVGGAQVVVSNLCGPDLATLGLTSIPTSYNSDSVWSYELGAKNSLFGGKLRTSASVFRINWSNIQQRVPLPTCGSAIYENLGKASSTGFDLDLQLTPFRGMTLGASVGYTDAKYDKTFQGAGTQPIVQKGDRLPTSKWTVALSAEQTFELFQRNLYVRGDYQYRSAGPAENPTDTGYDPTLGVLYGATNFVTMRAGVRLNGFDVSVFVDNLTNDHPVLAMGHATLISTLFYTTTYRPRQVGLTGTYRF